jgi:hypothetical protein
MKIYIIGQKDVPGGGGGGRSSCSTNDTSRVDNVKQNR